MNRPYQYLVAIVILILISLVVFSALQKALVRVAEDTAQEITEGGRRR